MQVGAERTNEIFLLLDDPLGADGGSWLLQAPERLIVCDRPDDAPACLAEIAAALRSGWWAAGAFAYELGYLMEPKLAPLLPARRPDPLVWLGLFRTARRLSRRQTLAWLRAKAGGEHAVRDLRPSWDRETYRRAFARARAYIEAGDVYQVNLTQTLSFAFDGDPLSLYLDLRRRQRVGCGGLLAAPGWHVLSLSPELFLRLDGRRALVRPMKGTAARGVTPEEDEAARRWLAADEKSRAENLMIVDLMRNDLGRLARPGDVRVTDLFTVETYRSLHQMTSGVTARLRDDVGLADLLRAIFPCGSVTGAPKIRAMQVISELEPQPRGVYTGALGLLAPDGRAFLNVAIRTLVLRAGGRGEIGIGSGVVFDSDADAEYEEGLLKAEFLTRPDPPFSLIETMRWDRDAGYALLDRHLARLAASAAWFAIPCDEPAIRALLSEQARAFSGPPMRVRLLLDEDGEATITATPLPAGPPPVLRYAVSDRPVSSRDPFLYHKTTRRAAYDAELARLSARTGCSEALFVNERGELTEGAWTNLFIRRGDRLLTPPVSCGLLDGTLRSDLLQRRPDSVLQRVLRPEDLATADEVLLGNSVRGLMRALPAGESVFPPPPRRDRQQ